MSANYCQYTKSCPVYQGKKEISTASLTIHKNVFCIRGSRGWNNCEQFLENKKHELITKNELDR